MSPTIEAVGLVGDRSSSVDDSRWVGFGRSLDRPT